MIDWMSQESKLLLNPKLSLLEQKHLKKLYQAMDKRAHLFISPSGTTALETSGLKLVALSHEALLVSAAAVNAHLQVSGQDRWLLALPSFHVGGLGVWARAYLVDIPVVDFFSQEKNWRAEAFVESLKREKITLTSLVPTQVYDLVEKSLAAPPSLRAVVVGGGALSERTYLLARQLGWPLLPSYGLSECASQVATADLKTLEMESSEMPRLKVLEHLEVRTDESDRLSFKGTSLFSGYVVEQAGEATFVDPKTNGWFESEDLGQIEMKGKNHFLKFLGRKDERLKINGEFVDLPLLQQRLENICQDMEIFERATLLALDDLRQGVRIQLVVEKDLSVEKAQLLLEKYNQSVSGLARSRSFMGVQKFPLSPLGKIQKEILKKQVLEMIRLK